jgi:hypothetical protein
MPERYGALVFAAMHSPALGPLKVLAKSMETQTFANPAEVKRARRTRNCSSNR